VPPGTSATAAVAGEVASGIPALAAVPAAAATSTDGPAPRPPPLLELAAARSAEPKPLLWRSRKPREAGLLERGVEAEWWAGGWRGGVGGKPAACLMKLIGGGEQPNAGEPCSPWSDPPLKR
jgi:hypothetical protein